MSAPAQAANTTITQAGSQFGHTQISGGLLLQGNFAGLTICHALTRLRSRFQTPPLAPSRICGTFRSYLAPAGKSVHPATDVIRSYKGAATRCGEPARRSIQDDTCRLGTRGSRQNTAGPLTTFGTTETSTRRNSGSRLEAGSQSSATLYICTSWCSKLGSRLAKT